MGSDESKIEQERESSTSEECVCFGSPMLLDITRSFQKKGKNNYLLGTPLPDTPDGLRRRRMEEAQICSYGFLDLETNSNRKVKALPPLNTHHGNENGSATLEEDAHEFTAQVHEGKNAEKELYKKYDICDVLGVGSTSTCHRCINRKTFEAFACKIIDKKNIEKRFKGMAQQLSAEILTLRSLHHPNIVSLYDVYITDDKIFIIMEQMEGGELFDYVVKKGTLTEDEASEIVRKVVSALVYLHQKNIIHRDLKPENLMLSRTPRSPLDLQVKIIDFGLSKRLETPLATSFLGTRGYLAPEMLQRRSYSRAVDAWALGVIVFVLLCGCLPFDDESITAPPDEFLSKRFHLRFPRWANNLSSSAKDLLSHLLDINARTRYTAEQAFQHPWVTGQGIPKNNYLNSPGRIHKQPIIQKQHFPNGSKHSQNSAHHHARNRHSVHDHHNSSVHMSTNGPSRNKRPITRELSI